MLKKDGKISEYTLVEKCGSGGFGEVWRAERRTRLSVNEFALKFFRPKDTDLIDIERVKKEIETWKRVSGSPNIVSIFEADIYEDYVYIVSEFADGGSLEKWLKENGGKAESLEQAIEITQGILKGLDSLHRCGFVHRDLKPANVLFRKGVPCLADFGISREMKTYSKATSTAGTYEFMPPEAFQKNPSVTVHTDIWGVGVIMQKLLTGTLPFPQDEIPSLITAILYDEPEPLPENVPPEIKEIIGISLRKDRENRFQSARDMRLAIEKALYKLRAKAAFDDTDQEDKQQFIPIAPVSDFTGVSGQIFKEQGESTSKEDIKALKIQPEVENVLKTRSSLVEETKDAEEIERERHQEREREIAQISDDANKKRAEQLSKQRKRKLWILTGVGSLILGLSIIGFLLASITEKNLNQSNSNVTEINIASPTVNESQLDNKTEAPPQMVYLSGGEFMMGRDDGKSEAESPAHKVTVQPFFMDIYEITNEQYAEFIKAAKYKPPTEWKNNNYPEKQEKFPVVGVNWEDASAFCKNAGKRLPSEEEWEFAARGTNNYLYPWGNDWKQGNANIDTQSFAEVGKYKGVSPFGIYDLIGNAWEWTSSDFKAYPNGKLPDFFAGKMNLKTIRGGSFTEKKDFATTTNRIGWAATGAVNYDRTGFRCVKGTEK